MTNEQIQALKAAAEVIATGHYTDDQWFHYLCQVHQSNILPLLAEREADKVLIAKLQSANAAQDDHINQQADRIESLEKTNAGLGKRLCSLEARTLTVKFPDEKFCPAEYAGSQLWEETEIWNKAVAECSASLKKSCAAAGITLSWEGSEDGADYFRHVLWLPYVLVRQAG